MFKIFITAFLLFMMINFSYAEKDATEFTIPKFTKYGVFAQNTEAENGKYKTITYLPPSTLLFDVKLLGNENGNEIYAATTQDGVKVRINNDAHKFDKTISKYDLVGENGIFLDPKADIYVIFDKNFELCLRKGCVRGEKVGSRNSFFIINNKKSDRSVVVLEAYINGKEKKTYFIDKDKFVALQENGNALRFNRNDENNLYQYPHYKVVEYERKEFVKECSERVKEKEKLVVSDLERLLITEFRLGGTSKDGSGISIGSAEEKKYHLEYKVYEFIDMRNKDLSLPYGAKITYSCSEHGKQRLIEKVQLIKLSSGESDKPGKEEIDLRPWMKGEVGIRERLFDKIKVPFLWSVNDKQKHHFVLMGILSDKFENRSIAAYFLAEFNRSCQSRIRKSKKCLDFSFQYQLN